MKKIILLFLLIAGTNVFAQFSGGSGTAIDPYQVATKADLNNVRNYLSSHFLQTTNIVFYAADFNSGGTYYNAGSQWNPISTFAGTYNGNGFTIDSVKINRGGTDRIGLFGETNAAIIKNLGVTNATIVGKRGTGIIVGYCSNSQVFNCFSTGSVNYTTVESGWGGLIGKAAGGSTTQNSYSLASVIGYNNVAGFIGVNEGATATNNYSTGSAAGQVVSGFISNNFGSAVQNSFWDTEASGNASSTAGTGKTTAEMKSKSTFTDATWDFDKIWNINSAINNGYPYQRVFYRIYVDATRPNDAGDGKSWATAKKTLQAAITAATTGYEIWVAAGTYKPTTEVGGSGDRFKTFQMKNGVEIYGGFAGTEAADYNIANRDFTTNETILSGDVGTENVSTDNCYHIFYHPNGLNLDVSAVLDGFTIEDGYANGASGFTNGAGMYNYNSNPKLNNLVFKDNYAAGSGAALNMINSNSAVTNSTFSNNTAVNGGGAVTIEGGSTPAFTDCTFSGNSVTTGSGGAVYVTATTITTSTFQSCTFSSNTASSTGGAFFADNGNPELTTCTFSSNTAPSGGAIYAFSTSNIVMNANTLYSNSANDAGFGYGGAIAIHSSCTLELMNSLLYSNTSTGAGGAIYIHTDGYGELINSTLSKNHAGNGGGIYYAGDDLTIFNSILWGNTSSNWGNQLERAAGAGTVLFNYSCFENDYTDGDYDIEGTVTANNSINTNPNFHSKTTDDYRILGSSPCVNAGSNTYIEAPTELTEDIREADRVTNITVDMGCYEYNSTLDRYSNRFFVKHNAAGLDNGSSWTNAYLTLQQALNEATNKDSIFVSTGTYKPTSTYNLNNSDVRNKHFRMIEGVSIFGSFAGDENVDNYDFDDRNLFSNSTILSGDIQTLDDSLDNCYHVFYHPDGLGLTNASILDGFEISYGNASGTDNNSRGGGMLNINNSPFLTNVSFSYNSSIDQGGAIYLDNSDIKLYHTMFVSNYANTDGGAIYITNGSEPLIVSSAFVQNGAQYSGGAINNNSSNSIISNSLFTNNIAIYGGGIFNQSALELVNSTLSENYAYQGGGIAVEADATINNSIIWSNDGVIGKDIFIKEAYTLTISYSDYSTESADFQNNGSLAGGNNIHLNPKFKSPYSGDFSILGISPCADAGNNTLFQDSWTTFDIRTTNSPRKINKTDYTQAGTIDMGCFEYNSNTDLLCRTEAWVSSAYSSSTPNWRETYFNNLDDAVNVTCDDATVNITNYSHTGDVEMGDRTFVVGAQDFDMTGDLSGDGLVQVTNTGKLIMNNLSANTSKTFPVTDGTHNYTMTVTTADNSSPDIKIRIKNNTQGGNISTDFWEIEGPINLNATVTLRVDKAAIAPKTLNSNTQLRYLDGGRYVPVDGNKFSIEEFDTYYIITLTGVNKF